jgi:hypothetical protein
VIATDRHRWRRREPAMRVHPFLLVLTFLVAMGLANLLLQALGVWWGDLAASLSGIGQ